MTTHSTRAAVIGAGAIARQHLGCLRQLPGVEIAGICDLSPAVAESMAERFQLSRWFTDHRQMLADVNPHVVHITTPPASHYPLAMDALDAGATVFVEKPITRSLEELSALQRRAADRGCLVIEDHNYLFNQPIQKLVSLVEEGRFGDVIHVDVSLCLDLLGPGSRYMDRNVPHPCLALPGGAVADFVTHMASLAWCFVGAHRRVTTTWSKTTDSPLPVEDLRALVSAERGTATLAFSSRAQPDVFRVRVEGSDMRAEADLFEPRFTLERKYRGPLALAPLRNGFARSRAECRAAVGGLWRKFSGGPGAYEGLWTLLGEVYEAFQAGSPPPVSDRQILEVNALVAELSQQVASPEYACEH